MKFIELFAGIGGFRCGLEKANKKVWPNIKISGRPNIRSKRDSTDDASTRRQQGQGQYSYKCVWANEIDKHACQIYRKNFGDKELVRGDIRRIPAKSVPDHDLLTAGFPCQSFSIAGKRKGFGDTRGTLFFEICRIAEAKRPAMLLLENVKGLLNHDGGDTFRVILDSLSELGYDCEWEVLNSKNFGVPQNRERVFIVGYLRGGSRGKVFPLGKADEVHNGKGEAESESTGYIGDPTDIGEWPLGKRDTQDCNKEQVANALEKGSDLWSGNNTILIEEANRQILLIRITKMLWEILGSKNREQPKSVKIGLMGGEREDGIAYCLRKSECNAIGRENRIRRLTPTECERIQGFPDNWTKGPPPQAWYLDRITDKQRYECLGNAVTVNVVEEIGKGIIRWIDSQKKSAAE